MVARYLRRQGSNVEAAIWASHTGGKFEPRLSVNTGRADLVCHKLGARFHDIPPHRVLQSWEIGFSVWDVFLCSPARVMKQKKRSKHRLFLIAWVINHRGE